ncbi:FIST N-terminal domain-containing protein [Wenyingzhuangia sp. 1_MG-2023]|nr:FIST N-terminal domain-containing protein [Wenyingzhuangia sp. 1_MG-2023]
MKKVQLRRNGKGDWEFLGEKQALVNPLVLVFGDRLVLESIAIYEEVSEIFENAHVVIGSSCGEITNHSIEEEKVVATAIEFEKSKYIVKKSNLLESGQDSFKAGKELIEQFPVEGLKYVFVLSEGSFVNGSRLTQGMVSSSPPEVLITGGLCGDSERFEKTIASYNEEPKEGEIIAVGFYGNDIEVSFSSYGGWTRFGPQRTVTKSDGNVLYELDGKPALDLYKTYLGDKSKELPSAALLYPLDVQLEGEEQSIVRTVLGIDEEKNAMILAGDISEGCKVFLMMSNIDNLVYASEKAVQQANSGREKEVELAILISCIGRKLVLDQRVEEEVENLAGTIGDKPTICGFYSYGEIVPFDGESTCKLHNQTITITLISE